jgi:hypothetical protein
MRRPPSPAFTLRKGYPYSSGLWHAPIAGFHTIDPDALNSKLLIQVYLKRVGPALPAKLTDHFARYRLSDRVYLYREVVKSDIIVGAVGVEAA